MSVVCCNVLDFGVLLLIRMNSVSDADTWVIPALYAEFIPGVRMAVALLLTELDDVGCVLQCSGFRCTVVDSDELRF